MEAAFARLLGAGADARPALLAELCRAHPEHAAGLRDIFADIAGADRLLRSTFGGELEGDMPARLGEFEVVREVGRGGMGVVYEAKQPSLQRTVALKVLPRAWVLEPRQVTRFQNEARAAATLDHPHIVKVYVVGSEQGVHFYAMQLIAGVSMRRLLHQLRSAGPEDEAARGVLAGLLPQRGAAPPDRSTTGSGAWTRRAADLVRQAAEAIAAAHEVGILHRDLKPGNLMVDARGHLWVTDFGLAHFVREASDLTRSGDFVGTAAYCSPEQVGGRIAVDARTDVYSLGATLYELLTLQPPFSAVDPAELVRQVADDEPKAPRAITPQVPGDLETIVLTAMAKEPGRRYESAAALGADLQAFLEGRPIRARPTTRAQRVLRWCRRNPMLAASLLGVLLLTMFAGGVGHFALRASGERDRALLAESHLARLSSQRRIEYCRETARALRQGLAPGRRLESLRLLRAALAEADAAMFTEPEREAIRSELRSDALASLGLWDASPEILMVPSEPGRPLAFDRAYTLCASQHGEELRVHDLHGRVQARLDNPGPHPVAAFSPDAEWIAISAPGRLRLWRWRSGDLLLAPGSSAGRAFCWSPDGRMLVANVERNRIVACDLAAGTWRDLIAAPVQEQVSRHARPWCLDLSPDGRRLAACFQDSLSLFLFEVGQDESLRTIELPDQPHATCWEKDSRHLLVGGRFLDLLRADVGSGLLTGTWPGHDATVVTIERSRGDDLIASGGWDSQIRLWDPAGRPVIAIDAALPAREVRFADDDRSIGWANVEGDDKGAVRWQLHRPVTLRVLRTEQLAHSGVPWAAFHPTIPLLAVSTHETVVFFDRERGDRLGQLTFAGPRRMRFLEDGTLFLAGTREGCWLLPVTAESPGVIRVGPPRDLEAARGLVEADHENRSTCIFDGSHLRTISRDGQEIARFEASQPAPAHLRLSPDGRYAALGTFGGTFVTVWEMSSGRKVHEVEAWQTHANPTFSPDGRHLVVARRDQHWMFQTGSWQKTAAIPRQRTDALPGWCTFSPDGSLLATPTGRSRLQVLKARSLEPLFELDSQGAGTGAAEFSADASHLAMVSVHREVLLWDLRAARAALRELGLDWSDAPIPEPPPPSPPMRLVIDTRRRGRARGGVLLLNAPGPAGLSSSRP